ncbi:MAG: hypothetical protein WCB18_08970 [Thermoplasmata archaeon]
MSTSAGDSDPEVLLAERLTGAVHVAGEFRTGVAFETLVDLLPEYGPSTVEDLTGWIQAHPSRSRVSEGRVLTPEVSDWDLDPRRRERAEEYYRAAGALFQSDLKATRPWLCFLGVTGSTAYGDPRDGDDCDLMTVVRPGAVWLFVAYVFLRLRLRRMTAPGVGEPEWCFNYTLDEPAAIREFSRPRGFLFAREALVTRPVHGEAYYRGLLRRGDWLRREAPRLYARWESTALPEPTEPRPATRGVRCLNAVLFPVVAAYLQLKGLRANYRLRRSGREGESFRTITRLDRMALATRKFERLSDRMRPASRLTPE